MSQQGRTFAVRHVAERHAVQLRLCCGDNPVIAERLYGLLTAHRRGGEAEPSVCGPIQPNPPLSRRDNIFIEFSIPAKAEPLRQSGENGIFLAFLVSRGLDWTYLGLITFVIWTLICKFAPRKENNT